MAFIDQVQDLTSLTVSDTDELSQFLKDGVIDVTNKWLAIKPTDLELFARESAEQTANASLNLNGAKIINVIREDGTNNQWRNCRKITPSEQYNVTDIDSLNYASKINPAYMIGDAGKISVFPAPGSDPNSFKVYYVNKDPVNSSGSALAHSHDDILYFPIDKVYLVVMYASMKLLQATMGAKSISTLSITAVPPDTPSTPSYSTVTVSAQTAGSLGTAPTYTAPSLDSSSDQITEMEAGTIGSAETDTEQWFNIAGQYIEDQEDPELASAQISKINTYLNAYGQAMQNQLNIFNDANVEYQSTVQEALQELQVAAAKAQKDADFSQQKQIDEYAKKLQRYQNEISAYQADVSNQVQEYQANLQEATTEYQWLQGQYTTLKADYEGAFASAAPKGR
jgi:DNA-binding transcriptional regulator YbjK